MGFSCEISAGLQHWLLGLGTQAPFIAAALVLLWWARKLLRREYFGRMPAREAWLRQAPAIAAFSLGGAVLLIAQLMG